MKIQKFNPSTPPSTLLEGCCFRSVLCSQGLLVFSASPSTPDFVGFSPSRAYGLRVAYRPCSPKKPPRRSRDTRVHPRTGWIFVKTFSRNRRDGDISPRSFCFHLCHYIRRGRKFCVSFKQVGAEHELELHATNAQ